MAWWCCCHIFARTYYKTTHDLAQLADVLGHTSIETTRLYLRTTNLDHTRLLDRLYLNISAAPLTKKRRPQRDADLPILTEYDFGQ